MTSRPSEIAPVENNRRRTGSITRLIYNFPWWALIMFVIGIWLLFLILADEFYTGVFQTLSEGVALTLGVSFAAYSIALVIGLVVGIIRSNPPRPGYGLRGQVVSVLQLVVYHLATMYVQVLRGLPILVVILIVAFVGVPALRNFLATFGITLGFRGTSATSAIIALAITYGAFLSEVFRGGIQSIERGQLEAARSLGMNNFQMLRWIVLPQALRRILPPLGNDMVAMIKDSSLMAIIGIEDITQIARQTSSVNFRFTETYLVVALLYLTLTVIGSMLVRLMEQRLETDDR
ncbi:MAG: amino acid ABC transporter permease, partial [Chloroflexi bacterium]|nr:amino acid ABC transporter permease [Chloroflexota bacterium]